MFVVFKKLNRFNLNLPLVRKAQEEAARSVDRQAQWVPTPGRRLAEGPFSTCPPLKQAGGP